MSMRVGRAALAVLLLAHTASADPTPVRDLPPGEDIIKPLEKGQPAPFQGQLFDPPTAMRWANWLQQYEVRLKADVAAAEQKGLAVQAYDQKVLDIEKARSDLIIKDLQDRLLRAEKARLASEEELRSPPWYKSPAFFITTGAVTTVAAVALSIWSIEATAHHGE